MPEQVQPQPSNVAMPASSTLAAAETASAVAGTNRAKQLATQNAGEPQTRESAMAVTICEQQSASERERDGSC